MTTSLSRVDGPGDAELISAVRGGDVDAYGELFARHVDSARRLARQLAGPGDADDLVSDAFTKVLLVLQRGGGPDLAFRAYLLTAVRRLHVDRIRSGARLRSVGDLTPFDPGLPFHDTAVEGFENAAAARAFASLPERWQMVLWHTEVEQQKPADIAPLLGMSANSVSALAYRAREGLRQAFLSQHAVDPDDVDCAWTRDHLGAYIRGGLSRRDAARVDDHIEGCRACAAVYLELTEVNSGLAALLAPLLLGTAGLGYLTTGSGSSTVATTVTAAKTWVATHASLSAAGGVVLTATAAAAVYALTQLTGHPAPPQGAPPLDRPTASSTPTAGQHQQGGHHGRGPGSHGHRGNGPQRGGGTPPTDRASSSDPSTSTSGPAGGPTPPTTGPTGGPTGGPTTGPTSEPTSAPTSEPTTSPTSQPTSPPPTQIAFTSTPPSRPTFGSTYTVSTNGSGTVVISVDPATTDFGTATAACRVNGSTVTFRHAGTCVIAADRTARAASTDHATQTIDVPQESQTVAITSAPQNPVVGGTSYPVTADPGVAGAPTITGSDACQAVGATVSFVHAATCTITASWDGNQDYLPATDTQTFQVGQGAQEITFTTTPPPTNPAVQDAPYTIRATSTSGGAVSFSTTSAACTVADAGVSAATVTYVAPGVCVVDADQAGTPDYLAAPRVSQTITVSDEVRAHLEVTAVAQQLHGNGQQRVTASVTGLPVGSTATLTVSVDSSAHITTNDPACAEKTQTSGQTFQCTVTKAAQTFVFDTTVNKGRPLMTFHLAPVAPLVFTPDSKPDFQLPLGDPLPLTAAHSPFARRTQN
ncbi:sigma-70 family RNA polymerase sigma factor [Nocardioides cynanchi]|uniref:sigma-70 family RNA polymerase sigma factor n=1 Tax=Nocardioides cynanchi TaxID=2558918 RepID=UPI00177F0ADB|nr:sigma-70 family RNA polymerase sigma factor [Nocardioides cynanchi]